MDITFPWYMYPYFPLSGYTDTNIYIPELLRLYDFLGSLTDKKILFHLTIGSAMEEYNNSFKPFKGDTELQWKQIFPDHVFEYAFNGGECLLILVSPDESFSIKTFIEPKFIRETNDVFSWKSINKHYYYSECYNIKFHIFNTMMPTKNTKKITNLPPDFFTEELARKYTTTENDLIFVDMFYKNMGNFFELIIKNLGNITCFSFAVFNSVTIHSETIKKFAMFPEILSIKKKIDKIIFAEWYYVPEKYILKIIGNGYNLTYNHFIEHSINKFNIITMIKIIDDNIVFIPLKF